jgi:putative tricarboxylic transport membrane protein
MKSLKIYALLPGILISGLGLFTILLARRFPELPEGHPGPALFPVILGWGLVICGLLLMVLSQQEVQPQTRRLQGQWVSVILILLLLAVFPFLNRVTGFLPAIGIALFLTAFLMKLNLVQATITALLTTGFIYLIFNLILHVPL